MMNWLAVVCCLVAGALAAEKNNFDYSQHGADWETCTSTVQQSPIDLTDALAQPASSFLFLHFYPQKATIVWLNTTVYIQAAPITLGLGQIYSHTLPGLSSSLRANEVRIRTHSEHKVNGKYFDLELQVFSTEVFPSFRNQKLAIGLLFEVGGTSDPFLQSLIDNYAQGNETTPFPSVNATLSLSPLLNNLDAFDFWFYQGSITIPNCIPGGMNWVIPKKVFSMSQEQRDFFWGLFYGEGKDGNWRAVQQPGDNELGFYRLGQ